MNSPTSSNNGLIIIDNYDSFTHNIYQELGKLGYASDVYRNDEISADDLNAINPSHIILGPGPGTPDNPEDIGVSFKAIDFASKNNRALLGICLGQQIMAKHGGGKIMTAPEIMHGKTSRIHLRYPEVRYPSIFEGIFDKEDLENDKCIKKILDAEPKSLIEVMRYHSLMCESKSLPPHLIPTAFSIYKDTIRKIKVIMAVQHQTLPQYGVQFHPESHFTEHGQLMFQNFANLLGGVPSKKTVVRVGITENAKQKPILPDVLEILVKQIETEPRSLEFAEFPCSLAPDKVYERLHEASDESYFFESLDRKDNSGTYSSDENRYDLEAHRYSYLGHKPRFVLSGRNEKLFLNGLEIELNGSSPLSVLENMYDRLLSKQINSAPEDQLLTGGFVGFMSYEGMQYLEPKMFRGRTPDDQATFCYGYFDDGLVYDRHKNSYRYYTRGRYRLRELHDLTQHTNKAAETPSITQVENGLSRDEFIECVRRIIQSEICTGNAQQVVLSRKKKFRIQGSMVPLYQRYRELYPSSNMHAIRMGDMESIGSFPELMMRMHNGSLQTIQLAGTRRRAFNILKDADIFDDLKSDPKEIAEHRMLVDQARNDVGRSAILGGVTVTGLMVRRDAGPVMHLASHIIGEIPSHVSPIKAHSNIFPMGTVSGSPKIRAAQIIHNYEDGATRGLYAGSFGFLI